MGVLHFSQTDGGVSPASLSRFAGTRDRGVCRHNKAVHPLCEYARLVPIRLRSCLRRLSLQRSACPSLTRRAVYDAAASPSSPDCSGLLQATPARVVTEMMETGEEILQASAASIESPDASAASVEGTIPAKPQALAPAKTARRFAIYHASTLVCTSTVARSFKDLATTAREPGLRGVMKTTSQISTRIFKRDSLPKHR